MPAVRRNAPPRRYIRAMAKVPMTLRGAELLRAELQRLKTVERPRTAAAIADARGHGDLSENAEYDAARERQALIEARIRDIEAKLANAHIIDPRALHADGRVVFGATVVVEDAAGATLTWQIVGEDEADIRAGRISVSSPAARALIGRHAGDEAVVQAPGGQKHYTIVEVRYV